MALTVLELIWRLLISSLKSLLKIALHEPYNIATYFLSSLLYSDSTITEHDILNFFHASYGG